MFSRTISAFLSIIVCTSAFWNVKATTSGVTPSEGHAAASVSTENMPTDTSAFPETTLFPVLNKSLNSTFYNESSSVVHSTRLSPVTTPTPVKNSTEAGSITIASNSTEAGSITIASTTLNLSVTVPKTEHESSTVIASTTLLTSAIASETGHVSSTINESNSTITVLPTQEMSTLQGNTTMTFPVELNSTSVSDKIGNSMTYSETILTSIFSTILVVVLLTILAFCFNKYRKRRSQYSHHPLHENVYESEGYSPPDDTLVISGGLYDAPRIYNPNMTVLEEEDSQHDFVSFSSRPGQFRLEFLPGDKDTDPAYNASLRRNV
ncbi:mucin-4-like [Hyla sarda]|uniref:mucin-4-like n=1 Tax=Hyla sarda TaxID=327740 RepID=UPI0024C42F2D|nr:mucin-4-like [Hyla sarda]XP_056414370.1 mucin-4-like [Hyla sarda]